MTDFELKFKNDQQQYVLYFVKLCLWLSIVAKDDDITVQYLLNISKFVKAIQKIYSIVFMYNEDVFHGLLTRDLKCKPLDANKLATMLSKNAQTIVDVNKNELLDVFKLKHIGYTTKIDKIKWSYPFWYMIHISALNTNDSEQFKQFIFTIPFLIPCRICKEHSLEYLNSNQIGENFFEFTSNLHQHSKKLEPLSITDRQNIANKYKGNLKPLYTEINSKLSTIHKSS